MTAQIENRFKFNGDDYSIVAISTPIDFKPQDYGITPLPIFNACWDGYWCEYEITKTEIILKNLYINSHNDEYPEINGISPENDSQNKQNHFQYMGHHLYKNLNIKMNFTGKILIGKGFLKQYYIHMGYQRAWAYEVLEELVFENGMLIRTVDHSEKAKELREELDQKILEREEAKHNGTSTKKTSRKKPAEKETNESIKKFVTESFSLKMEDKAWWLT